MKCFSVLLGVFELDSVLAYKAPKTVKIHDKTLGILRLLAIVGVLAYLVVKRLYIDQAYLQLEPVRSAVEWKIDPPQAQRFKDLPVARVLKPATELPYCTAYEGDVPASRQKPCTFMSPKTMSVESGDDVVFLATRIKDLGPFNTTCLQTEEYLSGQSNCDVGLGEDRFTSNAEQLVLSLRNAASTVSTPESYFSSAQAQGKLHCPGGEVRDVSKWYRSAAEAFDQISIQELLDCAGVSLDDEIYPEISEGNARTFRLLGVTLFTTIVYEHDFWGSLNGYHYSVSYIPQPSRRFVPVSHREIFENHPDSTWPLELRTGVRILLDSSGHQGSFSFSNIVIAFVEALAILEVATIAIFGLMIHVMPLKKIYTELLYEPSVDIAAFKLGEPSAVAAVEYASRHNMLLQGKLALDDTISSQKGSSQQSNGPLPVDTHASAPNIDRKQISDKVVYGAEVSVHADKGFLISEKSQDLPMKETPVPMQMSSSPEIVDRSVHKVVLHGEVEFKRQMALLDRSLAHIREQLDSVAFAFGVENSPCVQEHRAMARLPSTQESSAVFTPSHARNLQDMPNCLPPVLRWTNSAHMMSALPLEGGISMSPTILSV